MLQEVARAANHADISPLVIQDDCLRWLRSQESSSASFDLTFLDPPFNQGKEYDSHYDSMPDSEYWDWMGNVCEEVHRLSSDGAAIYFMQREKNAEEVLRVLRQTGWTFQNLIVWRKKTSAIPGLKRFGKSFQVIVFATKGERTRLFNRLRIDPPLPAGYTEREGGIFVTDVWDDIRELTSGFYAGSEPLRDVNGERLHKQQSPISLLTRIVLSSSMPGDTVLDPFAGTGTTLCVSRGLSRHGVGIEKSVRNVECINDRLREWRSEDDVWQLRSDYDYTPGLDEIWGKRFYEDEIDATPLEEQRLLQHRPPSHVASTPMTVST